MIYAWFIFWVFLIIVTGNGVCALLARLIKPAWSAWLLLPGTIVSEMAYYFGCAITGGEIRSAKLLPDKGGEGAGEAKSEAQHKLKYIGPITACLISIVACGGAILAANSMLGSGVIDRFTNVQPAAEKPKPAGLFSRRVETPKPAAPILPAVALPPKNLPVTATGTTMPDTGTEWRTFIYDQLRYQVGLLQQMTQTLVDVNWRDWKVPLFIYLTICMGVRLAPTTRPLRATIAAAVVISGAVAMIAAFWVKGLMDGIWPLLTFVWTTLLLMLLLMLLITGIVSLSGALMGKGGAKPAHKPSGGGAPKPAPAK